MFHIDQNTWVARPAAAVFAEWTDPSAVCAFVPGVQRVDVRAGTGTRLETCWHVRWLGMPRRVDIDVTEWVPGSRIRWQTRDGQMRGEVTFTAVNRHTTAVTVHVAYEPTTGLGRASGTLGLLPGRVRRTLVRFTHRVESHAPVGEDPDAVRGASPLDPQDLQPPPPTGVPDHLGVTGGAAHSAGSPGGTGSMGVSSDRVDLGGRVGPPDLAGVPAVPDRRSRRHAASKQPRR